MLILGISLSILSIILLLIEIKIYTVFTKCFRIQQEGKSYVEIISESRTFGWIQNRDIIAIQNNMKTREEHIRVEHDGEFDLIQVKAIKEIKRIKNVLKIVIGNL